MKQFTPQIVADMINQLGIKTHVDPVPSIFLGTIDFSLFEMVGAYGTFANKGIFIDPIFVTRIEDRNGNVLATFNTVKTEAISEQTAYLMINLLELCSQAPVFAYATRTSCRKNRRENGTSKITPTDGSWVLLPTWLLGVLDRRRGQGCL